MASPASVTGPQPGAGRASGGHVAKSSQGEWNTGCLPERGCPKGLCRLECPRNPWGCFHGRWSRAGHGGGAHVCQESLPRGGKHREDGIQVEACRPVSEREGSKGLQGSPARGWLPLKIKTTTWNRSGI